MSFNWFICTSNCIVIIALMIAHIQIAITESCDPETCDKIEQRFMELHYNPLFTKKEKQ